VTDVSWILLLIEFPLQNFKGVSCTGQGEKTGIEGQ